MFMTPRKKFTPIAVNFISHFCFN